MVELQFLGHSSFKIGFPGRNVLVDPFFECKPKDKAFERLVPCPLAEKQVRDIALLLITHEHFDHFDKGCVERIASRDNACVVAHDEILKQLELPKRLTHPIKMNETISLRGLNITAVAAHHPQAFYPMGFMLEYNGEKVFHAGDTDLMDDFSGLKPDIALLPIGGTFTMDIVDAVRAVKTMKPNIAVPMHFNTFKMITQDPQEFQQKIQKSILKTKVVVLEPGQKLKT